MIGRIGVIGGIARPIIPITPIIIERMAHNGAERHNWECQVNRGWSMGDITIGGRPSFD